MIQVTLLGTPTVRALELFRPRPGELHTLDTTARLAGVTRRTIAIYCRAGLLRPVELPPYGVIAFTDEAIHAVRRLEHLRALHGPDVTWLKAMASLLDEVERLRTEVRFLRGR